jgi:hypothetical protein
MPQNSSEDGFQMLNGALTRNLGENSQFIIKQKKEA